MIIRSFKPCFCSSFRASLISFSFMIVAVAKAAGAEVPEEVEVLVLGNSIGGFTAALLAAALHESPITLPLSTERHETAIMKVRCGGLVLCNTAGVTLRDNAVDQRAQRQTPSTSPSSISSSDASPSPSPSSLSLRQRARFPAYNPPPWLPPETFELVGEGIIRLLQPRVPALLQWLYPSVSSSEASSKKTEEEQVSATDTVKCRCVDVDAGDLLFLLEILLTPCHVSFLPIRRLKRRGYLHQRTSRSVF